MFTFCMARWARQKKNGRKIIQLKWSNDKNMGWTKQKLPKNYFNKKIAPKLNSHSSLKRIKKIRMISNIEKVRIWHLEDGWFCKIFWMSGSQKVSFPTLMTLYTHDHLTMRKTSRNLMMKNALIDTNFFGRKTLSSAQ